MLNYLSVFNLIITLGLVAGGFVAFRHGFARTAEEVQERVIHALQGEIKTLQDRIVALEKENTRLNEIIQIIRSALKQRGLSVTIDGELISIHDHTGTFTQTTRIHASEEQEEVY